jgi:hypothetical protein
MDLYWNIVDFDRSDHISTKFHSILSYYFLGLAGDPFLQPLNIVVEHSNYWPHLFRALSSICNYE